MKYHGILLALLLTLASNSARSQNIVAFTYDANGSRISRNLEVVELKSSTVSFPLDPDKLKEKEQSIGIQLYPNPFYSTIRLLINGFDEKEKKTAVVYNLAGTVLLRFESLSNDSDLKLNMLDDGVYILRLTIGHEAFVYKIIKSK
ncbi:MAG: T9SS type A sorting domain-containing protein [Bacteroidales bacterium]|jgi:hypothetical protein|nr:T9SS type A sorting domain-containing protein [Bacteroidales bacterium]